MRKVDDIGLGLKMFQEMTQENNTMINQIIELKTIVADLEEKQNIAASIIVSYIRETESFCTEDKAKFIALTDQLNALAQENTRKEE